MANIVFHFVEMLHISFTLAEGWVCCVWHYDKIVCFSDKGQNLSLGLLRDGEEMWMCVCRGGCV